MVADVMVGRDQGFDAFKIRIDWGPIRCDVDPAKDLEMARQVRAALGPDVWLGFDANRGYSVGTAIRQGREFERLGLAHFEEPLPEHDMAGLREVCRALDIPVSTGEQLKHRWDFRDLIEGADPDILQPDIVDAGGISEVVRIFQLAEVFAKPVMPHSPSAGSCRWRRCRRIRRSCRRSGRTSTRSSTGLRPRGSPSCSKSLCCMTTGCSGCRIGPGSG